ncbi:MAG: FAD-dependent oxidoreductase [Dehalococcoidales bacterium]|nr:FAD-dependent oxidoreductase [Dehalococcoidales bacterium]
MNQLRSVKELNALMSQIQSRLEENKSKTRVKVHLGTCGISSGANLTMEAFVKEIKERGLSDIVVSAATCIGLCGEEPTVTVIHPETGKTVYCNLTQDKVSRVVEEHCKGNRPVTEWTKDPRDPRFKLQEVRVLHNQDIDPMNIDEYIARGGYMAMAKALTRMQPEEVLAELKKSGLRGRGGAGFPTATKWGFVRAAKGTEKYVVCNGDEGDPGAYMNRAVLEGNPHALIEGMAIGAYCIGNVRQGYAYVRAEYPLAIKTLSHAINQAVEYGLLGEYILGTDFSFNLDIFPGAGAFVCGEETALLTSIEGKRGNPRQRPPFPANEGLFGKPTTLNNVETWSNIPLIILNGAEWFSNTGSKTAKGTKTLCLVGKVKDSGLIEVPLGTTLGEIIFDLGGGIQNDRKFKGVQLGGPSGGVIPAEHLNTPVDYDSIPPLGAIMGSGGVVVMDEDSCMVDVAKYFLDFTKDESCGKCISCREGNPKMYDILCKITEGKATMDDLQTLEELAELVKSASVCGLGQTAPNPVLTTLRYFRQEYEAHIIEKKCPAAVCQALFKAPCQHTCPVGLDVPGYISLIKSGEFAQSYRLIMQHMPFPMSVGRVCPADCQKKCRRSQVDDPVAIRHLKRFAADYAYENNLEYKPDIKPAKEARVAVIGSGPAGLSAAWDLAVEGYQVTVFEALPVAGGMLAVGIPEYRLPRKYLQREIENVQKLGVEIRLNSRIDNIPGLLESGYKAVLIAVGAHKGNKTGIPGEDLNGVFDAIAFLRAVNLGQEARIGKKVAVSGGGNSAVDAARTALRKGAEEVYIIYRREKADMPAEAEEVEAVEKEGITLHCLTNPTKVYGKNGEVIGIECQKMELREFDRSGRRRPQPIAGSEFYLPVDMLIEAIGQEPDMEKMDAGDCTRDKNGRIAADPRTLIASNKGVFISGDAFTGPATVIEAIASGQRAASSIRRFLNGEALSPIVYRNGYKPVEYPDTPPTEEETQEKRRVAISELSPGERKDSFREVVLSYSPEEAVSEAGRCLRCDLSSD